jgi:hypothetical protein
VSRLRRGGVREFRAPPRNEEKPLAGETGVWAQPGSCRCPATGLPPGVEAFLRPCAGTVAASGALLPPGGGLRPLWRFRGWRLLAGPLNEDEALPAWSRCRAGDAGASGFLCLRGEPRGGCAEPCGARLGALTLEEATPLDLFPARTGTPLATETDSLASALFLFWPDRFRDGEAGWAALPANPRGLVGV